MLDIEFLQRPTAIDSVIVYRQRSGYLWSAMVSAIKQASEQSGRFVNSIDSETLVEAWHSEGLFPATKLCELRGKGAHEEFRRLKSKFGQRPLEPVVIIVKAANWNSGHYPNVTLIDEPEISERNIALGLKYLASTSKFAIAGDILTERAFQRYFRNWIRDETKAPLPLLAKEFDRAILLYTKPGGSTFAAPLETGRDLGQKSLLRGALGRYLDSPTAGRRRAVMQAVAWRTERGVRERTLMDQLLRASSILVAKRSRSGCSSSVTVKARVRQSSHPSP